MHRRQIRGTPTEKTPQDANSCRPFGPAAARRITEGTGRSVVQVEIVTVARNIHDGLVDIDL